MFLITDRKPAGTIVFQMTSVADYAWVENARPHTTGALKIIHVPALATSSPLMRLPSVSVSRATGF